MYVTKEVPVVKIVEVTIALCVVLPLGLVPEELDGEVVTKVSVEVDTEV
jgi:hypothetical protein